MLATSHNATSATNILMSCLPTSAQLPSLALYSTSRLVSTSNPSANISTGSRCAIKRFHKRLIILRPRFFSLCSQRLGYLVQQIIIEYLAGDRRGGHPAVPTVLNQHGQGDLRLVGRSEGDEPGMVAVALAHLARDIFFILLDGNNLRSTGLAGNAVRRTVARHCSGTAGLGHGDHGALHQVDIIGLKV